MAKEEKQTKDTIVKGIRARVAFPYFFKKDQFERYSGSFIIEPGSDSDTRINEAIERAARGKWKGKTKDGKPKWKKMLKTLKAKAKICYVDGDDDSDITGYAGNMVLKAGNQTKPKVYDADKEPLSAEDGKPYSGCYVVASVEIWAQDNDYGQRINASLRGVQFHKDGEAFTGGGVADDDEFDDMSDGVDEDEDDEDEAPKKSKKKKVVDDEDEDDEDDETPKKKKKKSSLA